MCPRRTMKRWGWTISFKKRLRELGVHKIWKAPKGYSPTDGDSESSLPALQKPDGWVTDILSIGCREKLHRAATLQPNHFKEGRRSRHKIAQLDQPMATTPLKKFLSTYQFDTYD
jgi:hypothetical protein